MIPQDQENMAGRVQGQSPVRFSQQRTGQQQSATQQFQQVRPVPSYPSGQQGQGSTQEEAPKKAGIFDKRFILVTLIALVLFFGGMAAVFYFFVPGEEPPAPSPGRTAAPATLPAPEASEETGPLSGQVSMEESVDRESLRYRLPWQRDMMGDSEEVWLPVVDTGFYLDGMGGEVWEQESSFGLIEGYRKTFRLSDVAQEDFAEVRMVIHEYGSESGAESKFFSMSDLHDANREIFSSENLAFDGIGEEWLGYAIHGLDREGKLEEPDLSAYVVEFYRQEFWVHISFVSYDDYSAEVLDYAGDIDEKISSGDYYEGFA